MALRWKAVFLPVKEDLALKPVALALCFGAPGALAASFSRRAWSFCSLGLRPVLRVGRGFAGTSLMRGIFSWLRVRPRTVWDAASKQA